MLQLDTPTLQNLYIYQQNYAVWLGRLTHLLREAQSHWPPFFSTASCVKGTLTPPTKKLGCHEVYTNMSSAYEN